MARSKGRGRRASARRMKYDWVCNEETYARTFRALPPGVAPAAFPLTFPKMQQAMPIWGLGGADIGGNAFPTDGDRQFVKAVSGHIYWRPSGWAAGNNMTVWFRIVKKPMDLNTGDAIADALYDLTSADFANERFAWQYAHDEAFNTGSNFAGNLRVKATVNQWLEPDEALYFIGAYAAAGGITVSVAMLLRTLMGIPG